MGKKMVSNQEISMIFNVIIVGLFSILLVLVLYNILQHRRIYAFRTDDELWKPWSSQVYGLTFFIIGFMAFTISLFSYIFISHPEFFGIGLSLIILLRNPLENLGLFILSLIGLGIANFGMLQSILGIRDFINNIKETKGMKK